MLSVNCGWMRSGCVKSGNGFHRCKRKVRLTEAQDKAIRQGSRINAKNYTDFCRGHCCEFCKKSYR